MPEDTLSEIGSIALAVVIAVVVATVVTAVVALVVRSIGKRKTWARLLIRRVRIPFRVLLITIAVWVALAATVSGEVWPGLVDRVFQIATIGAAAWLVGAMFVFLEDLGAERYRTDTADNRRARRLRTQMTIIRRVAVAAVVVVALGASLLTFPEARTAGASVLASAGVLSIVAGLAVQSSLTNIFAGMQLAFSDAIRLDDVVIVEGEWGRIEEITLTYVVVHLWDDRRLVLPTNHFTTQPFQNWTRTGSELLGAVELDLDWRVRPDEMREELHRILEETELWDQRVSVLQVTDAVGGHVRIRVLVTAKDAPTLFDLRCYVRERLVTWLHESDPVALPRQRVEMQQPQERSAGVAPRTHVHSSPDNLFSGDRASNERGALFTGLIDLRESPKRE
ncbi:MULTISPECIES: mechanosensitive ion channel family protein [unclassified Rathayibacter]|uniref:mechanosensitive ion channel family protein n=1 Tax=unclassified Rathayibacter TaxID=2609250 RepID=UPI0007006A13|nr:MULTISPECIES: mechanosensitive ion channel domain-containing protein [unclassified Rathayibacter]KQQ04056.1 mechanosensitive ion channel protein MscS [Rathayibacter sp. Leaf294]KQS12510.1 mechanosensitive ion channel protein MscS [Rathayibacter sp. Leaf185]